MTHPEELRALVEALKEAEETLRLAEHPAFPDPAYHEEVKRLGRRIGFGALMSTASAGWRDVAAERGDPLGGEFVAGPCHVTVINTLAKVRTALARAESLLSVPDGGWKPIETAPHEVNVLLAYWDALLGLWRMEAGMASWGSRNEVASSVSHHGQATHWMPLPASPQGSSDNG